MALDEKALRKLMVEFDDAKRALELEFWELEGLCKTCPKTMQNCDSGCKIGEQKRAISSRLYQPIGH